MRREFVLILLLLILVVPCATGDLLCCELPSICVVRSDSFKSGSSGVFKLHEHGLPPKRGEVETRDKKFRLRYCIDHRMWSTACGKYILLTIPTS